MRFFAIVLIAFFTFPAVAQTLYRTSYSLFNLQIPLPEGDWQVAALQNNLAGNTPYPVNITEVALVRIKDKTITGITIIRGNKDTNQPRGWGRQSFCDRKDVHHTVSDANYPGGEIDCWMVNHRRMAFGGTVAKYLLELENYWISQSLSVPKTMLYTEHYFADNGYFLDVLYHSSPEESGFAPASQDWTANDWHRSRISGDAKRQAYVEEIKTKGNSEHASLKAIFARRN